MRKSRQPTYL